MYNNFTDYLTIFMVLLHRDMKVFSKKLINLFLNSIIIMIVNVLLFGSLLPALGISIQFVEPIYLGVSTRIFTESGFAIALALAADLKEKRFIHYQLSLPLPKKWLFAEYVTMFVIQSSLVTLPTILVGVRLLKNSSTIINTNWILFLITYFLVSLFFALLFLFLATNSTFTWFINNVWARVLAPLVNFGCVVFNWKSIYAFAPKIALLFLANPVTYACEGMRATLLGGSAYIDAKICIAMLSAWCIILIALITRTVNKKLDFS